MNILLLTFSLIENIERPFGIIAAFIISTAQLIYIFNTFQKSVTPSVLSWFGWSILMGTSLVSQFISKGWQWSLSGLLLSTIGCLVISIIAFLLKNYSLEKKDWKFLIFGLLCLCIYLLSNDPWITTCFAIFADFILGIPTLIKAYKNPASEKLTPWFLGLTSWTFALIICINHDWLHALFPIYLFLFNGTMVLLTRRKKTK